MPKCLNIYCLAYFCLGGIGLGLGSAASGAGVDNYLAYDVPADAQVAASTGAFGSSQKDFRNVGVEIYFRKLLVERKLYKNGKPHGIWRTYLRGKPESATPYLNGVMHGFIDHWDEKGQLVGHSWIDHGTGIDKVYHSNGMLASRTEYKNGVLDGYRVRLFDNGQIDSYAESKDGKNSGEYFSFLDDGSLEEYGTADQKGNLNGPLAEYKVDGSLNQVTYWIHGTEAPRDEYDAGARANDSTLPKPETDPMAYKNRLPEKVKKLIAYYNALPPAKIPLENTTTQPATQPLATQP